MNCPYCGSKAEADFVDNGVGLQQCGPYGCEQCHAYEMSVLERILLKTPRDDSDESLPALRADPEERNTGWWKGKT